LDDDDEDAEWRGVSFVTLIENSFKWSTGLLDFSWCKIPKRGKIYQITTNNTKGP
jgi:hypothetical protein